MTMLGNSFITPAVIAREALMILENNLIAANLVYRDHETTFTGAKVGDTITIRKPPMLKTSKFGRPSKSAGDANNPYGTPVPLVKAAQAGVQTLDPYGAGVGSSPPAVGVGPRYYPEIYIQDISEGGVPMVLDNHFDVSVAIGQRELTLEFDRFSESVIRPAMVTIANDIDTLVYQQTKYIPFYTNLDSSGAPVAITPSNGLAAVATADAAMLLQKIPVAGRVAIVDPMSKAAFMSVEAFWRASARGDQGTALYNASMGHIMGMDWYAAQNVQSVPATAPATVTSVGTTAAGSYSIAVTDITNVGAGDTFVAADGQSFIVTSVTAGTAPAGTVGVYPAVRADIAAGTLHGVAAHHGCMMGNMNGISLAVVPLEQPMGAVESAIMSDRGLSIRVVYGYDIKTKTNVLSFDLLAGCRVIQPELLMQFCTP